MLSAPNRINLTTERLLSQRATLEIVERRLHMAAEAGVVAVGSENQTPQGEQLTEETTEVQ